MNTIFYNSALSVDIVKKCCYYMIAAEMLHYLEKKGGLNMAELDLCCGCMNPRDVDENGICRNCGYNENAPYLPAYLAPGTMLNERYLVGKLLSHNGESADYIGYDIITESKVTIKEYMPDTLCVREKGSSVLRVNQSYVAQYKTLMSDFVELNKVLSKMRTLSHIIPANELFGDNNTGYAIFPYFEGITIGEFVEKNGGTLSWEEVRKLFPPIFTTLSLVHNAGLVHRGICPENILISEKGEIKLTGFAISDTRTANTELASEIYNGYAAPEQYNSSSWQGTWTDVYGICALLYYVLTGTVPESALDRMGNDTLPSPTAINPDVPLHVSKVIMNGMNLNGELRIQTVTELVTQLFEQPEYNSMRLSSSSTQTITIPRQTGEIKHNPHPQKKNKAISRHSLFIIIMAVILGIGLFFLLIVLLGTQESSSGNPPTVHSVTSLPAGTSPDGTAGETSMFDGSEIPETEPPITITAVTERPENVTQASASQTIFVMNDIIGKNYEIIAQSDSYNSLVFNPVYEYSDTAPKGTIFEQSIAKSETYSEGAEITVKVSLGPKYAEVPEYLSLNKKDYFAILNNLGIKYEEKEEETSDVKEGYVMRTSKEPGEKLDLEEGEILTVYVAKNPPETEPAETEPPFTEEPDIIISYYD